MKYFVSCSFGKDSIATALLALEKGEPLDGLLFCEVMYDNSRNISGEIPEHIAWIHETAIPKLAELGAHTYVVRSKKDYLQLFHSPLGSGDYVGQLHGFPLGGKCFINRDLKLKPIRDFKRQQGDEVTCYVGIAIDEPVRLARLKKGSVSLLAKYGYTEQMAKELCENYGLLSPIYNVGTRGGAGFALTQRSGAFADLEGTTRNCGANLKHWP